MPLSMFVLWLYGMLLAAVYTFCTLPLSFHLAFLNILTHFCTREKAFDPNLLKETNTFSHLPLSMFVSQLLIPQVLCFGTHGRLLDAIYVFCTLPSSFHLAFLNIRTCFCTREKASNPNLLKETNILLQGFQDFKSEFPLTRNKLIQELFGISKCMGNLLVVKHPRGDLDKIMDIDDSDHAIVDLIIRW